MLQQLRYVAETRPRITCLVFLLLLWILLYRPHVSVDTCGGVPTFTDEPGVPLPTILHITHGDDSPQSYAVYAYGKQQRAKVMGNDTVVMDWNTTTLVNWMEREHSWYLPLFSTLPTEDQWAVAPYFILSTYGGIYMSPAYVPLVNVFPYVSKDRVTLLESYFTYKEPFSNAIMASPPAHPFWTILQRRLLESVGNVGDSLLSSVAIDHAEMTYVLPCANFNRIPERKMSSVEQHTRWTKKCGLERDKCLNGYMQSV